jgi:hypothetical protein
LSAFAGYWVNMQSEEITLNANGAIEPGGIDAGGFLSNGGHYSWMITGDSYTSRISAALYPPGVEVQRYGRTIPSDTTKVRLSLSPYADPVFYHESDADSVIIPASPPQAADPQTSAPVQAVPEAAAPAPPVSGPLQPQQGDYNKIEAGDLSAFAGAWVNMKHEEITLNANGTIDGSSRAGGFLSEGGYYSWMINGDSFISAALYPPGVEVQLRGQTVPSDTTKVRLYLRGPYADPIFYHESDADSVSIPAAPPPQEAAPAETSAPVQAVPEAAAPAQTIDGLAAYIAGLPANTAATPHTVKLARKNSCQGNRRLRG